MKRFAIYYAPPEDAPLTRAASAWLGRDACTGAALIAPETNGLSRTQWEAVIADPRIYGFHATLKPPFQLAEGTSEMDLRERLHTFAASRARFEASVELGSISRFIALVLADPCSDFVSLAASCVREFDNFRAAPSPEELARRRHARLNQRQLTYLEKWGYPYVMDEWRFHMTLTASLGPETFHAAWSHLVQLFQPFCRDPLLVDSICLFEQEAQGAPFVVRARCYFR
jgi:putative phosphonate metabolism protein